MKEESKIRVVVDTNVWISFLIGRRMSNLMKLLTRTDVQLIFSEELLNELHEVSKRPKFLKYSIDKFRPGIGKFIRRRIKK